MVDLDDATALLSSVVSDADADQLPAVVGLLEAAKLRAVGRLHAPAAQPQPLVDAAEMARLLGVPKNWVRDKTRAGSLPCHELGHYVRYAPAEVFAAVRKVSKSHDAPSRRLKISKQIRTIGTSESGECPRSPQRGAA